MSYTPGPWRANEHFNPPVCAEGDKSWIVQVISGHNDEAYLANAHLIAAAPEMYEALETAVNRLRESCDNSNRSINFIHRIESILKKARGESK